MSDKTRATILIVDDLVANRATIGEALLKSIDCELLIAGNGSDALKIAERMVPDLILLDVILPDMDGFEVCRRLKAKAKTSNIPVIFVTAKEDPVDVVKGFDLGGVDYIVRPFHINELNVRVENHLKIRRLIGNLHDKNVQLKAEMTRRREAEKALRVVDEQLSMISAKEAQRWGIPGLVGKSAALSQVIKEIRKLHRFSTTSVMITGESGTGKELVARAIHYGGARCRGPFVPVNCSAIPSQLAESMLFGHNRGAFTGAAANHKGYFEQAHNGTLFLDEIGDMPQPLQSKLLRVLEESVIRRIGSTQEKKVDVRVLAGTNADLQSEIASANFRQDLYFRIARYTIILPPLRQRIEDIPLLAQHFLQVLADEMGMASSQLTPEAVHLLESHNYPGNIRELKNLVERALIETGGGPIGPHHLHFIRIPSRAHPAPAGSPIAAPHPKANHPSLPANGGISEDEQQILDFVNAHGSINNSECRRLLSVGTQRACYLLRKLHFAALLSRTNSGRWAVYRLP